MFHRLPTLFLLVAVGAASAGCGSYVNIRTVRPGELNVQDTKKVDLLQVSGPAAATRVVRARLVALAKAGKHFALRDRTSRGWVVTVADGRASLPASATLTADTLGARVHVATWQTKRDTVEERYQDAKGVTQVRLVPVLNGAATLHVTLFGADGDLVAHDRVVAGKATLRGADSAPAKALQAACDHAAKTLLADMTPAPVVMRVELDTSDPAQRAWVDLAEGGKLKAARAGFVGLLKQHPKRASAMYNAAVTTDALGEHAAALKLYRGAIRLGGPPWYERALAQCVKRAKDASALGK